MRSRLLFLALAAFPVAAGAAEWETGVRGYMNLGVTYGDPEDDDDGFGVFRDGEFHVRGKLTADNGLTFEARIEVEAFTTGDQIDENYGIVSGSFGHLLIGGGDTALNEHGGVGVVYPTGDFLNYYNGDFTVIPGDPGSFIGEDDDLGIRYWYDFKGFEAGVSYQPSQEADGDNDTNNPVFEANDQFAFGASYTGEFDGFTFAAGGGYLTNDEEDQWHVGLEAGFGGFTVAGFYNREDPDGASPDDLERYGIGAVYETGPWLFGGGYTYTNGKNGTGNQDFIHVGGSYALAPGVTARAAVQYGENEIDTDGIGGFAWLNIRF